MFINRLIKTKREGEEPMADTIDVKDLPEEHVQMLERWVRHLKARTKKREPKETQSNSIIFAAWPLGVKGKLTREEIYDYL